MIPEPLCLDRDLVDAGAGGPLRSGVPMRILLLCSTFNGLSQRAWIELRAAGHSVTLQLAVDDGSVIAAVAPPTLIW